MKTIYLAVLLLISPVAQAASPAECQALLTRIEEQALPLRVRQTGSVAGPVLVSMVVGNRVDIVALRPVADAAGLRLTNMDGTPVTPDGSAARVAFVSGPFDAVMAFMGRTTAGTNGALRFSPSRVRTDHYALSLVYPELALPLPTTDFSLIIEDSLMADILAKKMPLGSVEVTFPGVPGENANGAQARFEAQMGDAGLAVDVLSLRSSRVKVRGFPFPLYRTRYHAQVVASTETLVRLSQNGVYHLGYPALSFFQRLFGTR